MANPLFRWPGGKRWLAPTLVPYINGTFLRYVEPFLGAGAILFALEPPKAIAADTNPEIIGFFEALAKNPSRLVTMFNSLPTGEHAYYRIRDQWRPRGRYQKAARFLYLLNHSWNGIYRVNAKHQFNVPFSPTRRGTRLTLLGLRPCLGVLSNTRLACQGFEETLASVSCGDLVYLDPPYFEDGKDTFRRYTPQCFGRREQGLLAKGVRQLETRGAAWLLSNGNLLQIANYFPPADIFAIPRPSLVAANPNSRRGIVEFLAVSRSPSLDSLREALLSRYDCVTTAGSSSVRPTTRRS